MNDQAPIEVRAASATSAVLFYGTGLTLASAGYFLVFLVTEGETIGHALLSAFRNVASLAILLWPAHAYVTRFVLGRSFGSQLLLHIVGAMAFSLLWYWLLLVFIGLSEGSPTTFAVEEFLPLSGVRWQLLQGATVYAMVAATVALRAHNASVPFDVSAKLGMPPVPAREGGPSRYFIRRGDDFLPVEIEAIVAITGAGDYAEVSTSAGRHLVRMTLSEFEQSLPGERFIRVHRSAIVNVERVDRAEPAGNGRILLHMQNGETIHTSRTGAKLLRQRVL